jgi:ATP:corrinoid adenosyltransferase
VWMVRSGAIIWRTNKSGNTTSRGVSGQANGSGLAVCVWGNIKGTLVTGDSTGTRYRNHTTILFGMDQ